MPPDIVEPRAEPDLTFGDVLRFAAGYWIQQPVKLALILLCFAGAASLETYLPTALSDFLASVRQSAPQGDIINGLLVFLGIYIGQALLFAVTFVVYNTFETQTFQTLMNDTFVHVHRLSEQFFASTFTGSIISKVSRARTKIEAFEDRLLIDVFPTFIILIGSTYFLGKQFPLLAVLMVVYMALLVAASAWFIIKVSGPVQSKYADAQDHFVAHLADSISGIATTKSFAREVFEIKRFFDMTAKLRVINRKAYLLANVAGLIQRVLLCGILTLLLAGGTWYVLAGKASVESLAYLAFAYTILQSYIQRLGYNIKDIMTASYDLHAVIALLRQPPEVPAIPKLPDLTIQRGALEFDNVTFTYPGKTAPVFQNLSITIKPGERVALVGHSGSGKTTFVRLLQGLYIPQSGSILVDGQDIHQGSRTSLRQSIALVPQDPILFHRSLGENIAYGKPDAAPYEISVAAEQAHIRKFIESLPHAYQTLVGERGIKLSGGERQRIAIARAILANRPILILDEATSSLDSESERAIQDALLTLTHGRTSIMIAHRLSTILDADRILVFDKGAIIEEGTHESLLAMPDGLYAGLFRLQSGGFIAE